MRAIIFTSILILFVIRANAQFPNVNTNWKYIRADNTGVAGDENQCIRGDKEGNIWTGGRLPFYQQGSLVRYDGATWSNWGTYFEQYLPNHFINNITFDSTNTIWVGTNHGLATSSNGINWQHYNSTNTALIWDQIKGIATETDNDVWVVTGEVGVYGNGGVGYFNGNTWSFYTSTNSGLPSQTLNDIAIDQNNNKWIISEQGLIKFDGITWTLYNSTNSGLSSGSGREVMIDDMNRVWVCNGQNVDIFDGITWTHLNSSNWPVAGFNATTMYIRGNKIILTETTNSSRVMMYDGSNWTWTWTNTFILNSYIDIYGNFWTSGSLGIQKFNGTEWIKYTRHNTGLSENSNNDIFVDSKNRTWVANGNGGIQVFQCPNWEIYGPANEGLFPQPQTLSYVGTKIIETSDGDIWFTYVGDGGYAIQIPGGDYQNYNSWIVWDNTNSHPWFSSVTDAESTDDGKVFFINSYSHNTFMYNKDTNTWHLFDITNGITAIPQCLKGRQGGKMYLGHYETIDIYDNGTWSTLDLTTQGITYIFDIEFDENNNMWLGTSEGLWKYDGSTWINWNESNSNIAANAVWDVQYDSIKQRIYIGAHNTQNYPYYGGMSFFNGNGNIFTTFLEGSSSISHKQVEDIATDTFGNAWILTQGEGINVFNDSGVEGFDCINKKLTSCTTNIANPADDGPGTLRRAIECNSPNSDLNISASLYGKPINLLSPLLVQKNLTLNLISSFSHKINSLTNNSIMEIKPNVNFNIANLNLYGGQGNQTQGRVIKNAGTLEISKTTLHDLFIHSNNNGSTVKNTGLLKFNNDVKIIKD